MAELSPAPETIVDEIFELFAKRGHLHYGEGVSEQEHALQTATFAAEAGEDEALQVACLLHDVGHLVHTLGENIADQGIDGQHEDLGYEKLRAYFPAKIVDPVRLHVAAKRYLCTVDAEYRAGLSPASEKSLQLQGGLMSDEEKAAFESEPHFERAVKLRHFDDQGKVVGMQTRSLESYREALQRHLL